MPTRLFAVVRTVIVSSLFVSLWTWFLPRWIIGRTAFADQLPLGWIAVMLFIIGYEEPTLRDKFGDDYAEYCRHVRRWIPRVRPLD